MCSADHKTYLCTRCLNHFNHELYLKRHADKCPNKVMINNLIDSLRESGGYSKEIKRRFVIRTISYAKKLEAQLNETMLDTSSQIGETARVLIHQD